MQDATNKTSWQDDPVVQEFAALLRQRLGTHLRQILLFGSRARGDAQDGSDYDMLVVVDHRTPKLRGETEWQQGQELPLARNIAREGVQL